MLLQTLRFVSILLFGLIFGVSFSHVLQALPKATLPGPVFLSIQQILLEDYTKVLGALESATLVLVVLTALLVRKRRAVLTLTILSAACVAAMILVWAIFIRPLDLQVDTWTAASLPTGWTRTRDAWHDYHAIRALLGLGGMALLLLSVLLDGPARSERTRRYG